MMEEYYQGFSETTDTENFIGRQDELEELGSRIFDKRGTVSLFGVPQIGKSFLVNQALHLYANPEHHWIIQIDVASTDGAKGFWLELVYGIYSSLFQKGILAKKSREEFALLLNGPSDPTLWFWNMKSLLKTLLKEHGESGHQVILILEHFDSATRRFKNESHHFQLLKEIGENPTYNTSLLIISRFSLPQLEAINPDISRFSTIFYTMSLRPFNERDMEEFREWLKERDVKVMNSAEEKLEYYTGYNPYLLLLIIDTIVTEKRKRTSLKVVVNGIDVINAFSKCIIDVTDYYSLLIDYFKESGCLDILSYIAFDVTLPQSLTKRSKAILIQSGCLMEKDVNGEYKLYSCSDDFMSYIKEKKLEIDIWDTLMESEIRLKEMVGKEYPILKNITLSDMKGLNRLQTKDELERKYKFLNINWNTSLQYGETFSVHKDNPTLLEIQSLSVIVNIITGQWDVFSKYFDDSKWKGRLIEIKNIRRPIAHAGKRFVDDGELSRAMKYCEDIIRMDR